MAAGNWLLYDNAKEYIGDGTVDLDTDSFYMVLCNDTNAGIQVLTLDTYSQITTELSGNGYVSNGSQIQDVVWQQVSAGTSTFSCSRTTWTASGGDIGARYAVIYDLTSTGSKLICSAVLDTSLVTATDGNTFTVIPHASGIFALGLGNT